MHHARQKEEESVLLRQLEIVGNNNRYLWKIFFICMIPSILNGLNMTSYVYLTDVPQYWCDVPELRNTSWSTEQRRLISSPGGSNASSCEVFDLNFAYLSTLSFEDAWNVSRESPLVKKMCTTRQYAEGVPSMVYDFDLVCERTALKSNIQVAISLGKFLGAFLFGIVSDKWGRRTSFFCGSILYIMSGPLIAFAPYYWLVIIGRIGLGAAGSGIYHSAFVILSEIAHKDRRASIGILYNMSYPIGQMIVPIVAYFIPNWRTLQVVISAPAVLTLFFFWIMPESPMWLMSKQRFGEASKYIRRQYEIYRTRDDIFAHDLSSGEDVKEKLNVSSSTPAPEHSNDWKVALWEKFKVSFDQVFSLVRYSELRWRMAIAFFTWCVVSFAYYGLALNVDNFGVNRYVYGFVTGVVEAASYLLPLPLLKVMGRKATSIVLFYVAGAALMIILLLPDTGDINIPVLVVASLGRLCVSGVFAVIILHTTEMFPTLLRNTAIGIGSTSSHIGSMSAPLFVDLMGLYSRYIPSTVFGLLTLISGTLIFLLPETKNRTLPKSVEDVVNGPKNMRVGFHQICQRS